MGATTIPISRLNPAPKPNRAAAGQAPLRAKYSAPIAPSRNNDSL